MTYTLLMALFICHFLADFTHLSTSEMLAAKRFGKPLFPILLHGGVHGMLMAVVVKVFGFSWLDASVFFTVQMAIHTAIDTLKGKMNYWFPSLQSPANKLHWYVFGFDQFLHTLTILLMTYKLLGI